MEKIINKIQNTVQVKTPETEVREFTNSLTYWARFLCSKILTNENVSNSNIVTAYDYVLEELKLIKETEKSEIELNDNPNSSEELKKNL